MRTFKITAPTSRKVAERRTCFWKTWWVFCLAIAMMMMIERNSALPTLRYVTMLALSARAIHPVIVSPRWGSGLFKRSSLVIERDCAPSCPRVLNVQNHARE